MDVFGFFTQTALIASVLQSSMTLMVDLVITLSFVAAPILGYINYRVVNGDTLADRAGFAQVLHGAFRYANRRIRPLQMFPVAKP